MQHILGPGVLLESQIGNYTEILVVINVFGPRHHQNTKPRRKPKTLKCDIFWPEGTAKGNRRSSACFFFLFFFEQRSDVSKYQHVSGKDSPVRRGEGMYWEPFVYQSEASRVELINVRCLCRRTTLVMCYCGGIMTADGELDITYQRLRRHRLQGEHPQTALHTITTAGCSTRRLCR